MVTIENSIPKKKIIASKINQEVVKTDTGYKATDKTLAITHTHQDGTTTMKENHKDYKLTDAEFQHNVMHNAKEWNKQCEEKKSELLHWKKRHEKIIAEWRERRNKERYIFLYGIEAYEKDFERAFDYLISGRSAIAKYMFRKHPQAMYYQEKKQLLEEWREGEKEKAREVYFGELGKKYREKEETRLKQKASQRKWEKRKEKLSDIMSKIIFSGIVLMGIGVSLLVWGIVYEEGADLIINNLLQQDELTLGMIYDNNPLGLLLGWIPAIITFYIFLALVEVVLSFISVAIAIFPVVLFFGTIIGLYLGS